MKKKYLLIFLAFHLTTIKAQIFTAEQIKSNSNAPFFATLSVAEPVDYNAVIKAFEKYIQEHPLTKADNDEEENNDIWVLYFKQWRLRATPYINSDGYVDENQDKIQKYLQERDSITKLIPVNNTLSATSVGWRLVGPKNVVQTSGADANGIGNVYCVHFNKSNPAIGYAGSESGYVFKTTDYGETWTQVGVNYIFTGARSISTNPINADIVYVGGNNLAKSTDGGLTFTQINVGFGTIWDIEINPLNANSILMATSNLGVVQSFNAGLSFTTRESGSSLAIKYVPDDTTIVLAYVVKQVATTSFPTGNYNINAYKSTNAGVSFIKKNSGWITFDPTLKYTILSGDLAMSPSNDNRLYALVYAEERNITAGTIKNGDMAILTSSDMGETWTIKKGPWATPNLMTFPSNSANFINAYTQPNYNNWLTINPKNENELALGALNLYTSSNQGQTFSAKMGYSGPLSSHPDFQNFFTVNDTTWICNDGGLLKSTDFFSTQPIIKNNGIHCTEYWGLGVGWNDEVVTGGSYHNGNIPSFVSGYPANTFLRLGGAESPTGYVSPYNKEVQHSDISGVILPATIPGNTIGTTKITKFPNESYSDEFSDIVYHPNKINAFFLGSGPTLYVTNNKGQSYTGLFTFANSVLDIFIAHTGADTIYVVTKTDNKVWKSVNGGTNFIDITTGLPSGTKTLSGNLINAQNVFVLLKGSGNVYRTDNGGTIWTNIGAGAIAGKSGRRLLIQASKSNPTCYYFANNGGVYYKNNTTTGIWLPLLVNLPAQVSVRNAKPFYKKNKMFLAMDGLGIWEHDFQSPSEPYANFSVDKSAIYCSRDTVTFSDYSIADESSATATRIWNFPGASFVGGTSLNPKILYATPGMYNVTLTVTDGNNITSTKTIQNFITVVSDICKVDTVPGYSVNTNTATTYSPVLSKVNIVNSNKFTISFWAKPKGLQKSFSQILATEAPNSRFGIGFAFSNYNANLKLTYSDDNIPYFTESSITLNDNEWSYITLTYSPTGVIIYKNGQLPGWTRSSGSFNNKTFNLDNFTVNKDIHGQGGNFKGELDEIAFFDTVLTIQQIRENMHLTEKENTSHLVNYVQFNSINPTDSISYDAITGQSFPVSGTNIITSNAPVASGTVATVNNVNTAATTYNFAQTGLSLTTSSGGIYPNGTLVGFRLNWYPDTKPNADSLYPNKGYWIINNYGTNASFSPLQSINFSNIPVNPLFKNGSRDFKLWKRPSYECEASWPSTELDSSDVVTQINNQLTVTFAANNGVTSFSQFVMTSNRYSGTLALEKISLTAAYKEDISGVEIKAAAFSNTTITGIFVTRSTIDGNYKLIHRKSFALNNNKYSDQTNLYDKDVLPGNVYYYQYGYTLQNGDTTYSVVEKVKIPNCIQLTVSPDPAKEWLHIHFTYFGVTNSTATISIYDASGKMCNRITGTTIIKGQNNLLLPVEKLSAGVYWIKIHFVSGETVQEKFYKI